MPRASFGSHAATALCTETAVRTPTSAAARRPPSPHWRAATVEPVPELGITPALGALPRSPLLRRRPSNTSERAPNPTTAGVDVGPGVAVRHPQPAMTVGSSSPPGRASAPESFAASDASSPRGPESAVTAASETEPESTPISLAESCSTPESTVTPLPESTPVPVVESSPLLPESSGAVPESIIPPPESRSTLPESSCTPLPESSWTPLPESSCTLPESSGAVPESIPRPLPESSSTLPESSGALPESIPAPLPESSCTVPESAGDPESRAVPESTPESTIVGTHWLFEQVADPLQDPQFSVPPQPSEMGPHSSPAGQPARGTQTAPHTLALPAPPHV
jgi:hypothetical protein